VDEPSDKLSAPAQRRRLLSKANRIRANILVGRHGLTEAVVANVRRALDKSDLLKVRVDVERGAEADRIGADLAREVPCEVIKRIGKVLILYKKN